MKIKSRDVVITGIGMINPMGVSKDIIWNNMLEGNCGFRKTPEELEKYVPVSKFGHMEDKEIIPFLTKKKNSKYV